MSSPIGSPPNILRTSTPILIDELTQTPKSIDSSKISAPIHSKVNKVAIPSLPLKRKADDDYPKLPAPQVRSTRPVPDLSSLPSPILKSDSSLLPQLPDPNDLLKTPTFQKPKSSTQESPLNSEFASPLRGIRLSSVQSPGGTIVTAYTRAPGAFRVDPNSPSQVKSPMPYHDPRYLEEGTLKSAEKKELTKRKKVPQHTLMRSPSKKTSFLRGALQKAKTSGDEAFLHGDVYEIQQKRQGKVRRNFLKLHDQNHLGTRAFPLAGHDCLLLPGPMVRTLYDDYQALPKGRSTPSFDMYAKGRLSASQSSDKKDSDEETLPEIQTEGASVLIDETTLDS